MAHTTDTQEHNMIVTITRAKTLPTFFLVAPDVSVAAHMERVIVDRTYTGTVSTFQIQDHADAWLTDDIEPGKITPVPPTESLCGDGLNVYAVTAADDSLYGLAFRLCARDADEAEEFAMEVLGAQFAGSLRVQGQGPAPKWMALAG
jgi:hypothetical protein